MITLLWLAILLYMYINRSKRTFLGCIALRFEFCHCLNKITLRILQISACCRTPLYRTGFFFKRIVKFGLITCEQHYIKVHA